MSELDYLHEFLVSEYSFNLVNKTDSGLEYKSEVIILKINKDLSNFEAFSLDGSVDVYSIIKRLETCISDPIGILKALLIECHPEPEIIETGADGFNDDVEELDEIQELPQCKHDDARHLIIHVWGRKKRKFLPHKVAHNFNAAVLYGKKSGTDWSKDGRTEAIRLAVMKCPIFNDFLTTMIKIIEKKNASEIGINCRAGRHRSVTLAWILREHYYPNAKLHFLEIK